MNELEEKTTDRILRSAEEILATQGYETLSMRRIASRSRISQAAIYRHFANKAELVGKIVAAGYAKLVALAESVLVEEGKEDEALAAGIRGYVELSLERPELFRAVMLRDIGPAQGDANVLSEGVGATRRTFAVLVGLLERGMASGVFARVEAELSAQAVWAAMYGLAARLVLERIPPGPRREALIDRQIDILIAGLRDGGKNDERNK